jgi:CheY-like chemotaxis protein
MILYVDDDEDDRIMFCEVVKGINPAVNLVVAKDGREAMNILNEKPMDVPDAIFLDINMPVMDGFQTLVEIRKVKRLQHIKVVMYSTGINPKDLIPTACSDSNIFFVKKGNTIREAKASLAALFKKELKNDGWSKDGVKEGTQ